MNNKDKLDLIIKALDEFGVGQCRYGDEVSWHDFYDDEDVEKWLYSVDPTAQREHTVQLEINKSVREKK